MNLQIKSNMRIMNVHFLGISFGIIILYQDLTIGFLNIWGEIKLDLLSRNVFLEKGTINLIS